MELVRRINIKRRNIEYVLQYGNVTPFQWSKGRFRCFFCSELMKDVPTLKEHTRTVHQFANIELVVYDRTKNNRNKDAAVKIDISDITCRLCNQAVTNLEELISHLIIAHDAEYDANIPNCLLPFKLDNEPTCGVCNTKFVFFEYLLRHANKYHLFHEYMCDICGSSFQGDNHLRMHNRYYHKEGGHMCQYCDLTFVTLSKKILHEKNVHMTSKLTCPHCPETFKSQYFRKVHLANVHGEASVRFECPHCSKIFPQESIMSRHMRRVHLREKNVSCDVCGEKFFGPYDLKLHMVRHNGERKYMCITCGKKFSKKCNLNTHAVTHSGEKNYFCTICKKAFTHQNNLSLHMKNRHAEYEVGNVGMEQVEDIPNELVQLEFIKDALVDGVGEMVTL